MDVLNIKNFAKEYSVRRGLRRRTILAVSSLSFQIREAEIFALLGPNGAGKTTTLKAIISFIRPTKGEIALFGENTGKDKIQHRASIGYLPEELDLPEYYSVSGLLEYIGCLFGLERNLSRQRITFLLEEVGLKAKSKDRIGRLSMGQRRALGWAISLINDPQLLILDEPTVYLDPLLTQRMRGLLVKLKNSGKAVLLSSHILSEVEKVADRVAIIDKGRLLAMGKTDEVAGGVSLEERFLKLIQQ
jgi:ABC-2 type transport system ATP-binding protein